MFREARRWSLSEPVQSNHLFLTLLVQALYHYPLVYGVWALWQTKMMVCIYATQVKLQLYNTSICLARESDHISICDKEA